MDTQDTQNKNLKVAINNQNDHFDFYIGENAGGRMMGKLKEAKKSIKIVSPFLTEDNILDLVARCVEGISIYLITTVPEEKKDDIDVLKSLIHHVNNEYRVVFNTVFLKGSKLHGKLYIIDDEMVHTGSYNFTRSGVNTKALRRYSPSNLRP
jgi:phosphatidylserine/phosphatidylglycerophosphate/cardiolipin synthase-like enzyme